ncbi:hypothetical protein VKT23_016280 [Stygiomarasmius scandens]|uniref:Uncharacterized protein n=1 Tax=Marasmiellus scandens TaxID=2682957 RepID=A0ABR1IXD7_9AGAR
MLDFLFPSWRSRDAYAELEAGTDKQSSSPSKKSKSPQPKLHLDTSLISGPILPAAPQSITGFDDAEGRWVPRPSNPSPKSLPSPSPTSSTRSGPSAIAWLRPHNPYNPQNSEDREQSFQPGTLSAPARAALRNRHIYPMDRSVSSPAAPSTPMAPSSSSQRSARPSPLHSRSTLSLRMDAQSQSQYDHMNTYPGGYLVKPLSPIQELEYFSPETPRRTIPLPSDTIPTPTSTGSKGSNSSELTARPSPARSNPFISRTPKRSLSQSSSRSTVSEAPSIPPLDLRPPFPGPHPSYDGTGPPLRLKSSTLPIQTLPTIEAAGSSEEYSEPTITEGDYSRGSLHADSFVTASSSPRPMGLGLGPPADVVEEDIGSLVYDDLRTEIGVAYPVAYPIDGIPEEFAEVAGSLLQPSDSNTALGVPTSSSNRLSTPLSFHLPRTPTPTVPRGAVPNGTVSASQSTSDSFVFRRWEKDADYSSGSALGSVRFKKPKKEWVYTTPAFWAFWFGFICPILWLVAGWHFTSLGELPPKKTVWEFYFHPTVLFGKKEWWKDRMGMCLGRRRKPEKAGSVSENGTVNGNGNAGVAPVADSASVGNPVGDVDLEKGNVDEKSRRQGRDKGKGKGKGRRSPRYPGWIREKQSTESKIFKRSLRGISFGYPFINRPHPIAHPLSDSQAVAAEPGALRKCWTRFMIIVAKPNRIFDMFSMIKLKNIKGKEETDRRMFDPWIQRCRYAFCYAVVVFMAALATTSTFLIVYNTRTLR